MAKTPAERKLAEQRYVWTNMTADRKKSPQGVKVRNEIERLIKVIQKSAKPTPMITDSIFLAQNPQVRKRVSCF